MTFEWMSQSSPEWIEDLRFARINRADYELEDWPEDNPASAVEALAKAITKEFEVRKSLIKTHPHYVSPLGWLKPICYHAILTCLHFELFEHLEARNERYDRLTRGKQVDRSIFMIGLVGIFAHDTPQVELIGQKKVRSLTLTSEKERERLADAMWWGFRHYVSPSELNTFNRKCPLHNRRPKPPPFAHHRDLREQVIERRSWAYDLGGDVEHKRGGYSDEVEDGVEAFLEQRQREWEIRRATLPAASETYDPNWD